MPPVVADLSAIDTAVYNALAADATLQGLCPGGVHWNIANGVDRFVLLTRTPEADYANALDGVDGWLRVTYTVTAIMFTKSVIATNDAAYRIHELLHHGLLGLVAGNYSIMHTERTIPIRFTEADTQNTAARWQHHGGQYTVMVCPSE